MLPENLSVDEINQLINLIGYGKFVILLIVISILFNLTYIIKRIFERKKDASKIEIFQRQNVLLTEIKELLNKQYSDSISKDQAEALLKPMMIASIGSLKETVKDILDNNNITTSREEVEIKIRENLEHIWYENKSFLGKFEYKGRRLSEFIDDTCLEQIYGTVSRTIFNERLAVDKKFKTLSKSVKTHFENVRLMIMERITEF